MSKRRSKSAEFIGGFHQLERNAVDVADHVNRWSGHVDRWLRQLQKTHAARLALEKAPAKKRWSSSVAQTAECLATEQQARELVGRENLLVHKIDAVLRKISEVGFAKRAVQLKRSFNNVLASIHANLPASEIAGDDRQEPLRRSSGMKNIMTKQKPTTPKPGSMADIRERARYWGILPTYPKLAPPKVESLPRVVPSKRTVKPVDPEIPAPTGGQPLWKRKRKPK